MSLEDQWSKEGGAISEKYKTESEAALRQAYERELAKLKGSMAGTGYAEAAGIGYQSAAASATGDARVNADIAESKMQTAFYGRERAQRQTLEMEALAHEHRMRQLELTAELNDPSWFQQLGKITGGLISIAGQAGLFDKAPPGTMGGSTQISTSEIYPGGGVNTGQPSTFALDLGGDVA